MTVSYEDRLLLAVEWLAMRFEQRDNFLADSDLIDAAELFTTSERAPDDWDEPWVDDSDFERLINELDHCTSQTD
jgi:hypothetical protein